MLERQALAKPLRDLTPPRAPHKAQQSISCDRNIASNVHGAGDACFDAPFAPCLALTLLSLLQITRHSKGEAKARATDQQLRSLIPPLCLHVRAAAQCASAASKFVLLITGSSPYMRSSAPFSHESIVLTIIDNVHGSCCTKKQNLYLKSLQQGNFRLYPAGLIPGAII